MENERDGFIEKLKKLVELGNSKKGILEVEEINDGNEVSEVNEINEQEVM